MNSNALARLIDLPFIGNKLIRKILVKKEGGPQTSTLLRCYVKNKYGVNVGNYTYGSCFDRGFNTGGGVEIGRYTSFGPNVHYFGANHPMNYASMSPYFYQKSWGGAKVHDIERFALTVGNDCWIGYGTVITCGCRNIGNGAIVGAGSIVTKDVPPYSVVAGNPARVIRMRFDEKTITVLEKSQWWDLEPNELLDFYEYIDSPMTFAEKIIEWKGKSEFPKEI